MASYEFPAPWLNGRPIDAPKKIDMLDWYSQTDGYYPDATEHDGRNSILRLFRSQGTILFDDEFRSQTTANYDHPQTIGRVNRVFRAIEMISRYKAACEDGADLSNSARVDFITVWRDYEGNVIPEELMHNLQRFDRELENRCPDNSPVRAFWMGQEVQRSLRYSAGPITTELHQNHPLTLDNSIVPRYCRTRGYVNSSINASGQELRAQAQNNPGLFGPDAQRPSIVLNPTTADFIPCPKSSEQLLLAQKLSTSLGLEPTISIGNLATQKTELARTEIIGNRQIDYNRGERDHEDWSNGENFIPTLARPNRIPTEPVTITETAPTYQFTITQSPPTSPEAIQNDLIDSAYCSGGTPPRETQHAAATARLSGNSGDNTDKEISKIKIEQKERPENGGGEEVKTPLALTPSYRAMQYHQYQQDREDDIKAFKKGRVNNWVERIRGLRAPLRKPEMPFSWPEMDVLIDNSLWSHWLITNRCYWLETP